ncbi:hypothetical protein KI387_019855 [Taxus chinensis]|uniref:Uncharacterized protein n=1 Tax=Taxus chinensis TaxID=29808 RepID=A0AA38G745_TAXCH|nr:hypothetical protein KI387_019855 [Taxus chinensis]
MVLDGLQMEKPPCTLIHEEEMFSFPFGDEDDLNHAIHGGTRPSCDEPTKGSKEQSVQDILRATEETENLELSLELLIQAMNLQDKHESNLEASTSANIGHVEIKRDEKFDVPPKPIVDGHNNKMDLFSFPFEEEDSFHDEEIEARSFDAFEAKAPLDKGVIECNDSQNDEVITLDIFLELQK